MIYIASDHAGYELKNHLKRYLDKIDLEYEDLGTNSKKSVDYPDYAKKVALKIRHTNNKGVLICGTGTGMVIAANRFKGIRAALIYDEYSARKARQDNDSNIACLRGRNFNIRKAKHILSIWLKTNFAKKRRYKRRIKKLG